MVDIIMYLDYRDGIHKPFLMPKAERSITLKEAAEISGYAPDYIGQLIRKGKLEGKQIYHSVAWVTTEEAVRAYLTKNREQERDATRGSSRKGVVWGFFKSLCISLRMEEGFFRFLKNILRVVAFLLALILLTLFYIFSVSLEKKLQKRAIERARHQEQNIQQSELPTAL